MKKRLGLLSILLGVVGIGMVLLSVAFGLGIVMPIGIVIALLSIVGGLVSAAIEEDKDVTSWSTRPDDGLQNPTKDKGQFHLAGILQGLSRRVG